MSARYLSRLLATDCLSVSEPRHLRQPWNGQRLLELCTFDDLCTTHSFFRTKLQHKISRRHPRSKHWHQLDLIPVRRAAIENVLHTRTYHSADCDTDHSLVCCKIRMQPKKFHHTKGIPRIGVSKMSQPDLMEQFAQTFEKEFGSLENWWLCHREVVSSVWHYVSHFFSHLWEEVLKITWLVRSQINCDDPRHLSQASCPRRVQTQWRNLQILRITRSKA